MPGKSILKTDALRALAAAVRTGGPREGLADHVTGAAPDTLYAMAARHEVASLAYRNLKRSGDAPAALLDRLRDAYYKNAAHGMRLLAQTMDALEVLRASGVPAMPVKGPLASEIYFGAPGLYASVDVDLLVRPADVRRAEDALRAFGYAPLGRSDDAVREGHFHITLIKGVEPPLELHWNMQHGIPAEFWWGDAREANVHGQPVLVPSPGRYLALSCVHLLRHDFNTLKFLCLTAALLEAHREELDTNLLREVCGPLGIWRLVAFTCCLASDMLGAPLPAGLGQHAAGPRYGAFRRMAERSLMSDGQPGYTNAIYIMLLSPARELLAHAKRALAPSPAQLRLRYGLGAGRAALVVFYALNPFVFPFMLLRRMRR